MTFDLKPNDVLENPLFYEYHYNRLNEADLSYPLCVTNYKGKEIIVDGIHRLAKLKLQSSETIAIKVISESDLRSVAVSA